LLFEALHIHQSSSQLRMHSIILLLPFKLLVHERTWHREIISMLTGKSIRVLFGALHRVDLFF
jgi:hypothetical protein